MKTITHIILSALVLATLLLSTGCGTYYGKGISGADYVPLDHPWAEGEKVTRNYISGTFANPFVYVPGDKSRMGALTYYKSGSQNGFIWGLGGTAFAGTYDANSIGVDEYGDPLSGIDLGTYSYLGGGFRGKLGLETDTWDMIKWEVFSMQWDILYENGEYTEFRRGTNLFFDDFEQVFGTGNVRFLSTFNSKVRWKMGDEGIGKFGIGCNVVSEKYSFRGVADLGFGFDRFNINAAAVYAASNYNYGFLLPTVRDKGGFGWQVSLNYSFGGTGK